MEHAYNLSTQETEAEYGEFGASLSNTVRPYLKNKLGAGGAAPVIEPFV
jgi:hypothetical protein